MNIDKNVSLLPIYHKVQSKKESNTLYRVKGCVKPNNIFPLNTDFKIQISSKLTKKKCSDEQQFISRSLSA